MKAKCKYDPDVAYEIALQTYIHHGGERYYADRRGFIECTSMGKPIGFTTYVQLKGRIIIERLGVLERYRRADHGSALLARYVKFRKPLEMFINLRNLPAIKFLQFNGFKMVGHGDLYINFRKEWVQ